MKRAFTLLTSISLAAAILGMAAVPLSAAPLISPIAGAASTDVVNVGHRDRFERRGGRVFLNGNQGFRHHRRGFREHNGFWFPASAFLGAVIIGEVLNAPRIVRRDGSHVGWCLNRYRSYHPSSNTFQPYYGSRRACYSPYN